VPFYDVAPALGLQFRDWGAHLDYLAVVGRLRHNLSLPFRLERKRHRTRNGPGFQTFEYSRVVMVAPHGDEIARWNGLDLVTFHSAITAGPRGPDEH
jgi:hypothetical protein